MKRMVKFGQQLDRLGGRMAFTLQFAKALGKRQLAGVGWDDIVDVLDHVDDVQAPFRSSTPGGANSYAPARLPPGPMSSASKCCAQISSACRFSSAKSCR